MKNCRMRSTTALSSSTTRIRGGLLVTLDIEPALTYQIAAVTSHTLDARPLRPGGFPLSHSGKLRIEADPSPSVQCGRSTFPGRPVLDDLKRGEKVWRRWAHAVASRPTRREC